MRLIDLPLYFNEEEASAIKSLIEARASALGLTIEELLEKYPLDLRRDGEEKSAKTFPIDEWKQHRDAWHQDSHPFTKNDDNSPKIFYHGTGADFDIFRTDNDGQFGKGAYFSNLPEYASGFAHFGKQPNVIPVFLKITNPYIIKSVYDEPNIKKLKKQGFDGLIKFDKGNDGKDYNEYVVFNPSQIKSIFNHGTFDPEINSILYQAAYHGTPHEVDKFTTMRIGTGDGNQSFGYGLYFAGDKEVAEYYANNVKNNENIREINETLKELAKELGLLEIGYRTYSDPKGYDLVKEYDKLLAERDALVSSKGNIYKVDLKPEDHEYLKWDDKPNKKVIAKIAKSLNTQGIDSFVYANTIRFEKDKKQYSFDLYNGCSVYQGIAQIFDWNEKRATEFLHTIGIKGIKYRDGSSRNKGEVNYNYVIFHDDDVEIIERLNQSGIDSILPKALIEFGIQPGETFAVIKLFKEADVSSLPHELAHYFRRTLEPDLLTHAEDIFKVKKHRWSKEDEEAFALGFVKYLATCDAPTEKLEETFAKYGEWLKKLWNTLQDTPESQFEITLEHKAFYDQMLSSRTHLHQKNTQIIKSFTATYSYNIYYENALK